MSYCLACASLPNLNEFGSVVRTTVVYTVFLLARTVVSNDGNNMHKARLLFVVFDDFYYIKKNCIQCFSYPAVRTCPNYRAVTRSPASDNACARACVEAQLNRMRKQCFNQRTTWHMLSSFALNYMLRESLSNVWTQIYLLKTHSDDHFSQTMIISNII